MSDATSRRESPAPCPRRGVMDIFELVCGWCAECFEICRSCYRGHAYCGPDCRHASREVQERRARREYAATPQGREKNRLRQKEFRRRRAEARSNRVTDQGSVLGSPAGSLRASAGDSDAVGAYRSTRRRSERKAWGHCACCGRQGWLEVVPAGWMRRRRRFVPPDRARCRSRDSTGWGDGP